MTQSLLKSRLLVSAQSAPEQLQPDFETQFEEFKAIVHSVLYSESGYLAIAQSLDEALGLLEESLPSKKKNVALVLTFAALSACSISASSRTICA